MRSSPSPDWKAASSSDRTDWSRAIGVYSFGAFGQEHTEDHADGPLMGGPSAHFKAHHSGGHCLARAEMPQPGDRSPGFFIEPSRCWAFVYDHNLQSTHCRESPSPRAAGTPLEWDVVAGVDLPGPHRRADGGQGVWTAGEVTPGLGVSRGNGLRAAFTPVGLCRPALWHNVSASGDARRLSKRRRGST